MRQCYKCGLRTAKAKHRSKLGAFYFYCSSCGWTTPLRLSLEDSAANAVEGAFAKASQAQAWRQDHDGPSPSLEDAISGGAAAQYAVDMEDPPHLEAAAVLDLVQTAADHADRILPFLQEQGRDGLAAFLSASLDLDPDSCESVAGILGAIADELEHRAGRHLTAAALGQPLDFPHLGDMPAAPQEEAAAVAAVLQAYAGAWATVQDRPLEASEALLHKLRTIAGQFEGLVRTKEREEG